MMATRVEEGPRLPGAGERVLQGKSRWGVLPFLGVASNLMAMLIQTLSAKLGIATGRNLPEVCRERFSRRTSVGLWIQAELIAMATDLAEFLGAALGIKLLLGIPLFPAAVITGVITFLILGLQRYGFRPLEAVITAFVAVIGICYLGELWIVHPPLGEVAKHAVLPEFSGNESVLLAVGILGATVMPHVIYLHSALTQHRIVPRNDEEAKTLYRYTRIDVLIAMVIAGLINMSMLVIAATVFFGSGLTNVESLEGAHRTLQPLLGGASSVLFALALTASGLSSSTVGTAGDQPGSALVRDPVRTDSAGDVHEPSRHHGSAREPSADDRDRRRGRHDHLRPEHLSARPDLRLAGMKTGRLTPPRDSPSVPASSLRTSCEEPEDPDDEQDQSDPQQELGGGKTDAAEDQNQQQQ